MAGPTRLRLAAAAIALAAGATTAPAAEAPARGGARLRPPPLVDCPRDLLTVYAGQVTALRRSGKRTMIRIRTDWATTETVAVPHGARADPGDRFLIEGRPFEAADWARIVTRAGQLRRGVRAAAWVCDDGRPPVVDWQPPRER